jgi:protein-tyrosine phosphatase
VLRDVAVEREGETLVVRWATDEATAVDVAMGPTPAAIDQAHDRTVPEDATEARLPVPGPGRFYVSVAPHASGPGLVAGERRLAFEGPTNFRDLGGYHVDGGGHTAWGKVFRADALYNLTAGDLVTFEHLGMKAVYDLRGDDERTAEPNPMESVHLPFISRAVADAMPMAADNAAGMASHEDGERLLATMYSGLLEHSGPIVGDLLTGLSDRARLPAVFHCLAGKDRTGLAAALLLLVLGVEREDVLDDYELTRRYRARELQQGSYDNLIQAGIGPEAASAMLGTPRAAMAQALAVLEDEHGGAEHYLLTKAGMAPGTIEELRRLLVERSEA